MSKFLSDSNKDLLEVAKANAEEYQKASPFPNGVYHDFFDEELLSQILDEFPDLSQKDGMNFKGATQIKLAGRGERFFGDLTRQFMHFLNSEPFLNFLQELTGIKEPLIPDPYFAGGGQHEIKRGGLLKVHSDFRTHRQLKLDRRINVLVYLNKNWKEEYGGHFELWNRDMTKCEKQILPTFNTMAIFSTTDFSFHGHPNPLSCPEDMSRKSLALYYYSNGRPKGETKFRIKKKSTVFKSRKGHEEDKEAIKKSSKFLDRLFPG